MELLELGAGLGLLGVVAALLGRLDAGPERPVRFGMRFPFPAFLAFGVVCRLAYLQSGHSCTSTDLEAIHAASQNPDS